MDQAVGNIANATPTKARSGSLVHSKLGERSENLTEHINTYTDTKRCSYEFMRSEAKGWYEAERGFDARCGPDAWRRNRRLGRRAVGLRRRGRPVFRRVLLANAPRRVELE